MMPYGSSSRVLLAAVVLAGSAPHADAQRAARPDVQGEWIFEMTGDPQPQRVVLTVENDSVRGRVYGQRFAGVLTGRSLQFVVGSYRWRGMLNGDTLTGWTGSGSDSSAWRAQRHRPPASPRSFAFAPTRFPRALSAKGEPALRIYPGDTVRTRTLDAGGWDQGGIDARGNRPSPGGNPLTGPFYVEGAVPGDVLEVRLHRVRLNRDWAFSGTSIVDNAVSPAYAATRRDTATDNKWTLDTATGMARLRAPGAGVRELRVPLSPFLGVVAVAPGGDWAPSSRESGSFGGNLESRHLREGATVYLPVSTMGAYLYIGDGHAAQGDGELTGDAMETSMDVTFSVQVKRWGFGTLTRAETPDDLLSLGTGGSLDEALRRATVDLARWLESDYDVNANEVALIMGFATKYDIPDVVPPGVGVTARIPKSALATLRRRGAPR